MELDRIILDLINQGASIERIKELTFMNDKELNDKLIKLRNKGYNLIKKHYYSGDIIYKLNNSVDVEDVSNIVYTNNSDKKFNAIIISDLHMGNKNERIDLLYKVYEYAIKNGYHIIINLGDLIDGYIGGNKNKVILDAYEQMEYAIKNYPYDKNILNFILYGNHDIEVLTENGLDITKGIENERPDLISLGYGLNELIVKNDSLILFHPKSGKTIKNLDLDRKLVISGHFHDVPHYRFIDDYILVEVGSLSNLTMKKPSFMTISCNFKNGLFDKCRLESFMYFDKKFIKVSESDIDLLMKKHNDGEILNEENIDYQKNIKLSNNQENEIEIIKKYKMKYGLL